MYHQKALQKTKQDYHKTIFNLSIIIDKPNKVEQNLNISPNTEENISAKDIGNLTQESKQTILSTIGPNIDDQPVTQEEVQNVLPEEEFNNDQDLNSQTESKKELQEALNGMIDKGSGGLTEKGMLKLLSKEEMGVLDKTMFTVLSIIHIAKNRYAYKKVLLKRDNSK